MLLSHFAGARQVLSFIHMTHARIRLRNVPVYVYAHQRDLQGGFVFRKKCVDVGAFSKGGKRVAGDAYTGAGSVCVPSEMRERHVVTERRPTQLQYVHLQQQRVERRKRLRSFLRNAKPPDVDPPHASPPPPSDNTNCILAQALQRVYLDMCIMN